MRILSQLFGAKNATVSKGAYSSDGCAPRLID